MMKGGKIKGFDSSIINHQYFIKKEK